MFIRHVFHTENDLVMRVSQRFIRRWQRLLRLYEKRRRKYPLAVALKCVSVAWAFCSSVEEGKASVPMLIADVLENRTHERIELEGSPFVANEDNHVEQLVWDTVCLMLEEEEPRPEWQYAFDIASPHATMAYKAEVMDEVEEAVVVEEKPAEVSKVLTTTMSEEVMQKATDNSELTAFIADCVAVLERKSLEERQKGCHVLMRMVVERDIPLPPDLRERLVHLDDEKPQPTTLVFKDHSSYNPNAKDVNYYGK